MRMKKIFNVFKLILVATYKKNEKKTFTYFELESIFKQTQFMLNKK